MAVVRLDGAPCVSAPRVPSFTFPRAVLAPPSLVLSLRLSRTSLLAPSCFSLGPLVSFMLFQLSFILGRL
jgi:hypothetical protein